MSLAAAIRAGDAALLLDLLRAGAAVEARDPEGLTPLMLAAGQGRFHLAEILLAAGADPHAIEPRMGATALHKAVQAGDPDIVTLLLRHGAFIDQQTPSLGNTPLIDAVLHGQQAAVQVLLRQGARLSIANHWGQTARDLAAATGQRALLALLEERDKALAASVAAQPLAAAARDGDQAAVARLIEAGAPLDARLPVTGSVDDHYTPLGLAAREGHVDIARRLLQAGADPQRLIGLMGGMALHDATYFGHAGIVRLLADHAAAQGVALAGLDVQGAYNGMTALHDAVWQGHAEVARALLKAGARRDLRDHTGRTPRELALRDPASGLAALLAEDRDTPPAQHATEKNRETP